MNIMDFRNEKTIDAILANEEKTTMEKLQDIVGNNYFTNANRAKGIYRLIQENKAEINSNNYLASAIANKIKSNCLQDFKRIADMQGEKNDLPDTVKNLINEPIRSGDLDR